MIEEEPAMIMHDYENNAHQGADTVINELKRIF